MKIEASKVVITEVPGVESITIAPDALSAYGVHVAITYTDGIFEKPISFGYDELTELHAALGEALKYAKQMGTFPLPEPRVWREGDFQPDDVSKVTDKDGDSWRKDSVRSDYWLAPQDEPGQGTSWTFILREFGPLTEGWRE